VCTLIFTAVYLAHLVYAIILGSQAVEAEDHQFSYQETYHHFMVNFICSFFSDFLIIITTLVLNWRFVLEERKKATNCTNTFESSDTRDSAILNDFESDEDSDSDDTHSSNSAEEENLNKKPSTKDRDSILKRQYDCETMFAREMSITKESFKIKRATPKIVKNKSY